MKSILYGTTALMAVGLMAGTAVAAEKIKLGLGGYWRAAIHLGDSDNDANTAATGQSDRRDHGFGQESEIYFSGKTTLDNGIKFGVMVQLEGETSGDQIDNTYIWSAGNFGRVEYGETWGVSLLMSAGSVGDMIDGHGDFASHGAHANVNGQFIDTYGGDAALLATPDQKLNYFTPRMSGFQLGVSYMPENYTGTNATGTGLNSKLDGTIGNELVDVAANYVGKVGGADVRAFGSFFTSESEGTPFVGATAEVMSKTQSVDGDALVTAAVAAVPAASGGQDVDGFSVGAQIGFSGFRVGGRYTRIDDIARPNGDPLAAAAAGLERTNWRIGVDYGTGPWKIGIAYMQLEQEVAGATVGTKSARDDKTEYVSIGGSYNLGPGIKMFGGLQIYDFEDSTGGTGANAAEADNTVAVIGTKFSF
jgi:outer membrane protein OmpU